jgi:hypothetical protein
VKLTAMSGAGVAAAGDGDEGRWRAR